MLMWSWSPAKPFAVCLRVCVNSNSRSNPISPSERRSAVRKRRDVERSCVKQEKGQLKGEQRTMEVEQLDRKRDEGQSKIMAGRIVMQTAAGKRCVKVPQHLSREQQDTQTKNICRILCPFVVIWAVLVVILHLLIMCFKSNPCVLVSFPTIKMKVHLNVAFPLTL